MKMATMQSDGDCAALTRHKSDYEILGCWSLGVYGLCYSKACSICGEDSGCMQQTGGIGCFVWSKISMSWYRAMHWCASLGGQPPLHDTIEIWREKIVAEDGPKGRYFWIGLRRRDWRDYAINGTKPSHTLLPWQPGEPQRDKECAVVTLGQDAWFLSKNCTDLHSFVCIGDTEQPKTTEICGTTFVTEDIHHESSATIKRTYERASGFPDDVTTSVMESDASSPWNDTEAPPVHRDLLLYILVGVAVAVLMFVSSIIILVVVLLKKNNRNPYADPGHMDTNMHIHRAHTLPADQCNLSRVSWSGTCSLQRPRSASQSVRYTKPRVGREVEQQYLTEPLYATIVDEDVQGDRADDSQPILQMDKQMLAMVVSAVQRQLGGVPQLDDSCRLDLLRSATRNAVEEYMDPVACAEGISIRAPTAPNLLKRTQSEEASKVPKPHDENGMLQLKSLPHSSSVPGEDMERKVEEATSLEEIKGILQEILKERADIQSLPEKRDGE